MRFLLGRCAVLAVALAAGCHSQAPQVAVSPSPTLGLPGIPCGSDSRSAVRYLPTEIALACGDNGIRAVHLSWLGWTSRHALAHGVYVQNDCTPTCLGGHLRSYPSATFEFLGPLYDNNFSTVVVTFAPGHRGPDGQRRLTRRL